MRDEHALGTVQRTLILCCGALPAHCGAQFETLLSERGGPTAATAVVTLNGAEASWATAVTAALNRISPPDLGARLAQAGWQLAQPPALHLILLLSAEADSKVEFPALLTTAADQIYQQLGLEPLVFPIWLVGDGAAMIPPACRKPHYPLPLGNLVLGLCNQEGLRLPDENSLCAVGAELLWCFTTSPLFAFLEQRQTDVSLPDDLAFLTAGIHVWTWSPEAVLPSFSQRWRQEVIAQWLLEAADRENLIDVPLWLDRQQLTPKQFATFALREREAILPQLPEAEWRMPWPWQIPALFEKSRFENSIDEEATRAYAKQAQLRLFDPLQQAVNCLHDDVYQQLNAQPVGGIAQALAWLQAVSDRCEAYLPHIFAWETDLNEVAEALSVARGELEASLQTQLTGYPATPQGWLRLLGRPWRWPGQWLRYWRLQKAGQQLCHLYTQQAALRRQRIEQQTASHGVIELMQTVRRLGSQVAEIGDMLRAKLRSEMSPPAAETATDSFPLTTVSTPSSLYTQLLPDMAAEATIAAAAIGGLGSHIRRLDESLFGQLAELAVNRLAALNQLTPADLLLLPAPGQSPTAGASLPDGWAAACPLWPVDLATLDETTRQHQTTLAVLCGAHTLPLSDPFGELTHAVFTLTTGWPRHLSLVRFHFGMPATAVASFLTQEVPFHE